MAFRSPPLLALVLGLVAFSPVAGCSGSPEVGAQSEDLDEKVVASVVFSPRSFEESHLAKIVELLDGADESIDIAMYSFSDSSAMAALGRAVDRGVKVRLVFDTARADDNLEGEEREASRSAAFERMGVNVRFVNKVMHHKFVIVDGPRDSAARARTAKVASGSANWSNGAATKYDENTVFFTGSRELTLKLQSDFNLLWEHSREFAVEGIELPYELSSYAIDEGSIPDDPTTDAVFTSDNFSVKDTTFRVNGANTVADVLVAAIHGAEKSIHVAAGHLRLRPVAEALMARAKADPALDLRVYLDGQEYLGDYANEEQHDELEDCLAAAGDSESKQRACTDRGFLFSKDVSDSGIQLRFKYYAYRWDASYAKQMHHKYMVIDGDELYTGSYNLSDNAEHNTFENVLVFRGKKFERLVGEFEENFEAIWETGRAEGHYEALLEEVRSEESFPIVFEPMALTWDEVTALKGEIREACPAVDSSEYRQDAASHQFCE